MTPPPAEDLLPRLFLGPALRTQSDRRLVGLVREGHEAAFDEIMRRYGGQLRRYAGAIVGGRAEDVTQEAFSKALQALRRDGAEIELRPWLYRIVRNTALNDIRDRHPATMVLADGMVGQRGVVEEVERREEVAELLDRLRALPEPQRAAIVMRELEGLGHEEIASALGISDGAARQAIHRARTALRNGLGMAVPLPLLRAMLEAAPSAEAAAGGVGAGVMLKAATATVLVAGSFGAGVALHQSRHAGAKASVGTEAARRGGAAGTRQVASNDLARGFASKRRAGNDDSTRHSSGGGASNGRASGRGTSRHSARSGSDGGERHSGSSPGGSGERNPVSSDDGSSHPGSGGGTRSGDGGGGSGSNSGSGSGGSGTSGSGGDGSGSGDLSGSGEGLESNSGPGSGSDGTSDGGSSGGDSSESRDSFSGDGLSGQTQLQP